MALPDTEIAQPLIEPPVETSGSSKSVLRRSLCASRLVAYIIDISYVLFGIDTGFFGNGGYERLDWQVELFSFDFLSISLATFCVWNILVSAYSLVHSVFCVRMSTLLYSLSMCIWTSHLSVMLLRVHREYRSLLHQQTIHCCLYSSLSPLTDSSSLHSRLYLRDPHSLDTACQVRSYNLYQSLPIFLSHLCHSCRLLLHGLFAPSSRQRSRNQTLFGLLGGFVPPWLPHSLWRYDAFTTLTLPIQTT